MIINDCRLKNKKIKAFYLNSRLIYPKEIVHNLEIIGPNSATGENCQFTALYDNIDVTNLAAWTNAINGNVTISESYNNQNITIIVEYQGLTATKTVTLTYKSGSSTNTEVVVNDDGTKTETTTTTNSDGSSNSTTVNYDEDGNETGHSSTTTDTSGNSQTQQVTKDENGNDVVTGFIIDTSGNENGGMTLNDGVDTGIIAFDGNPFTIHLKAKFDWSENYSKYLIAATQKTNYSNSYYNGFGVMLHTNGNSATTNNNIKVCAANSTNGALIGSNGVFGSFINFYFSETGSGTQNYIRYLQSGIKEYTIDIEFQPSTSENGKQIICRNVTPLYTTKTGTSQVSSSTIYYSQKNASAIPNELTNATIYIGEFPGDNRFTMQNLEVLEFNVQKSI